MPGNAARSRRSTPRLTVIYWRDIPAQVRAQAGRERASAVLPDRFMRAVDAAATRAGKTTTDEYIAEWREDTVACGPDLRAEAEAAVERIAVEYPPALVRTYVANGGWAPGSGRTGETP